MGHILCAALSKFSEAIIEYCANIDKAPDQSITQDRFSQEIGSAFDVLFSSWLQSKEAKVQIKQRLKKKAIHIKVVLFIEMNNKIKCYFINSFFSNIVT